jgi:surface antigen
VAGAKTYYSRRRLYNRCARARLWRGLPPVAALLLALAGGGCSISTSQFDAVFGGGDRSDITGSIGQPPAANGVSELPPAGDLAHVHAAASAVLSGGGKDASAPWENPSTGARGTVTPIASAYTQDGRTCHDFLASYVSGRSQVWMQGEACKQNKGSWEVRALNPWKQS